LKTKHYLVEKINGEEYNIFCGTEEECKKEMKELREKYNNNNVMYISTNRFN